MLDQVKSNRLVLAAALTILVLALVIGSPFAARVMAGTNSTDPVIEDAQKMITEGRQTFRFDTFGDEEFWGGQEQTQARGTVDHP
jgi:hypothetical protein